MDKLITIKAISNACGVLPQTIRTWEKRYQVFNPARTEGGQRVYGEEDLIRAKLIVSLLEMGHSISKVANKTSDELRELVNLIEPSNETTDLKTLPSLGIKKLLQYLSSFDIDAVAAEMHHLRVSLGSKEFIFKIVLPVMSEIGLLVAKGKYSVTQEHVISTVVRDQLGQIDLPNVGSRSGRIALATPEGNLHELPIIMADILCRANRYSTSYLGAAHPAECLAEAINAIKVKSLVLGAVSSDQWNYKTRIIPYLKEVDKYLKHEVDILLGGGLAIEFPSFDYISSVHVVGSFEEFDNMLLV